MYPYFEFAGREFSTYWTIFTGGVILAYLFNLIRARHRMQCGKALALTTYSILLSFLGGKLLYYLENWDVFLESGIRFSGVSLFGAIFMVPVGMGILGFVRRKNPWKYLDFCAPSLLLILGVIRLGCMVNGCCGGISATVGGFYFSKFPTQLTEAICDWCLMIGLVLYEKLMKKEGRLYPFLLLYYGIIRFCIEFLRDTPKDWLGLSHGQVFAIIAVISGSCFLHKMEKADKKRNRNMKGGTRRKHTKKKKH